MPGTGPGSSAGGFILGKAGAQEGEEELWTPDCTGHCWTRALENNAFNSTQERVWTSGDALYKSRCHMAGRDGEEETAASQWPLVRCIYNRAQCRGRSRQQVTSSQETHTGILRWALQTCAGSGKWQQLQLPCQGHPHGLHGHTGVRPASGTSPASGLWSDLYPICQHPPRAAV